MTVRKFSGKRVSRELLGEMLEAAAHAPTNGNMQLYSVIITRDAERKRLLSPTHFNQPASVGADVLVTFCADFNRFVKWCYARDAKPGYDNFQSFMSAVFDTVILAQQFCTIAEQEGLGTCYLGTTAYNAPQIAEILELPKRVVPVMKGIFAATVYRHPVSFMTRSIVITAMKESMRFLPRKKRVTTAGNLLKKTGRRHWLRCLQTFGIRKIPMRCSPESISIS